MTNWYGIGLGLDAFYNDAVSNETGRGLFCADHDYKTAEKIRFGIKYRIWDNLYLQALAKTHRHIAEYIEFGIGYQIPFLRKDKRDGGLIFHHSKRWWEKY